MALSNVNLTESEQKQTARFGLGFFCVLLALVLSCCLSGCSSVPPTPPSPQTDIILPGTANYATNLLQEGDVVSITFQYSTNFNAVQKINLDGLINLEGVGQIKASGKTQLELQAELAKVYRPQTKDDVVTVKLSLPVSSVYVAGSVFKPGKVVMERPLTVLEAVIEAGGFDPNRANLAKVTVLRIVNGKQMSYPVNLKLVLQGMDQSPFYLRPFDIIHVPTKTFNF